jgi:hypothetical protein
MCTCYELRSLFYLCMAKYYLHVTRYKGCWLVRCVYSDSRGLTWGELTWGELTWGELTWGELTWVC